jgi:hypothetical protein
MPVSPLEASSRVNEQVTVAMLVKAAKNCPHCSQIFLDSEEDHHDPNKPGRRRHRNRGRKVQGGED